MLCCEKKYRHLLAIGVVLLVMSVCLCCDDDEQDTPNNQDCEGDCYVDYFDTLPDCDSEVMTCLQGCEGPDDSVCIDDCRECWNQSNANMTGCMVFCPCLATHNQCVFECNDHECIDWCGDDYQACIGDSSYYVDITLCLEEKDGCENVCTESSSDMSQYIDCATVCNSEFSSCLPDLPE